GELAEESKAYHLQTAYHLSANLMGRGIARNSADDLLRYAEREGKVPEILSILRKFFDFLAPLYIGMTSSQSLRDRLDQHLSGTTALQGRLTTCGIAWTELNFCCMPLDEFDAAQIRSLEKLFQALCKPQLSSA